MTSDLEFDHQGDAYVGRKHTEQSISFGMESKKVNKKSACFSADLVGAKGEISAQKSGCKVSASWNESLGHVEGGYSVDYTKGIPEVRLKAGADLANFSAEIRMQKDGMEHKLLEANVNTLGVNPSAKVGGHGIIPTFSPDMYVVKPSISAGYDDILLKVSANDSSVSGKLSGIGSVTKNNLKNTSVNSDIGKNTYSAMPDYVRGILGRSGIEKGSPRELYAGEKNRRNLLADAERLHKINEKKLRWNEKKERVFARRCNNLIADKSTGCINKLNNAIEQSKLQRQTLNNELSRMQSHTPEANKLLAQTQRLENDINKMTREKNHLESDRDRANANLSRIPITEGVHPKSTEQIVSDARENADKFQQEYQNYGLDKKLANSAISVCDSRNELNRRIEELNERIGQNDRDVEKINNVRNDYLTNQKMTLQEALEKNDSTVINLNSAEEKLRQENQQFRDEKGECQKALLETDKNFCARPESAQFEQNDRKLKSENIDNENAQAAKDDAIANYCNSHGIEKNGRENCQDAELQNLLNEKAALEKDGKNIQDNISENKKNLAESEKNGKTDLRVGEKDGNADVKLSQENYKAYAQDRKELRSEDHGEHQSQEQDDSQKTIEAEKARTIDNQKEQNESQKASKTELMQSREEPRKQNEDNEIPTTALNKSPGNEPEQSLGREMPQVALNPPTLNEQKQNVVHEMPVVAPNQPMGNEQKLDAVHEMPQTASNQSVNDQQNNETNRMPTFAEKSPEDKKQRQEMPATLNGQNINTPSSMQQPSKQSGYSM